MTKHLADHRTVSGKGKLRHFLRLAKAPRETWHSPRREAGTSRLVHFLRIARGRTV